MKKCLMILSLVLGSFALVPGYTEETTETIVVIEEVKSESPYVVFELEELNEALLTQFFSGNLPTVAIRYPAGLELPFDIKLKGDLIAIEGQEGFSISLKTLKECYIRNDAGNFTVSSDLVQWQTVGDFFQGSLGMSITVDDDGVARIGFEVELNERRLAPQL